MFKQLLKNTKFRSEIRTFSRGHDVLDVLLFGSVVAGKEKPRDIDILVLFAHSVDLDAVYALRKSLEKLGISVQVTAKAYRGLFDPNFHAREAFLSEGYSLLSNTFIAEGLGYTSFILIKYALRGMSKSARMRFYYSLHGRGAPGILSHLSAQKLSDNLVLAPVQSRDAFRQFFEQWSIPVVEIPLILPARLKGHF